jgi:hypothetical protein
MRGHGTPENHPLTILKGFSTVSEEVVRMASTWYVGFSALMTALKSCSILAEGKRRKFDGESVNSQPFCLIL